MSYHDKLQKTGGQRKLLACDGGGIRGIIAIEILARLEADLRKGSGNPLRGIQPEHVQQMDSVEHIDKMQRVGGSSRQGQGDGRSFHGFFYLTINQV